MEWYWQTPKFATTNNFMLLTAAFKRTTVENKEFNTLSFSPATHGLSTLIYFGNPVFKILTWGLWVVVVHPLLALDWIRPRSDFTCPTFSYQQLEMRNNI